MRRRRNKAHARRRTAHLRDPRIHLRAGKLSAFAGLRTLRHFDLQFLRLREVEARHAEAARRDLLDRAVLRVAALIRPGVARGILAAFAGVRLAADAVHRDGERLVRLAGDRAVAHRARLETLQNFVHRLDFLDRHRRLRLKIQQPAQRVEILHLLVHERAVLFERLVAPAAHRLLQRVDRLRIEKVRLALATPLVFAADVERVAVRLAIRECVAVPDDRFLCDDADVRALDARRGRREVFVHDRLIESDGLENLRAAVALHRRDADLRRDFDHALRRGLDEILHRLLVVHIHEQSLANHVVERLEGEIRIDGAAAVADERAEVMHFARLAAFEHEIHLRARALADEVMVQTRHCEQRRNRRVVLVRPAIGKDQDVLARRDRAIGLRAEFIHRFFESRRTAARIEKDRQRGRREASLGYRLQLREIFVTEDRRLQLDEVAAFRLRIEQVTLRTDGGDG